MGLDMYLSRIDRKMTGYIKEADDVEELQEENPEMYNKIKPYLVKCGSENYSYESLFEEVGYWRKANHIHKWFVDNVQVGVDDCRAYEVNEESLTKLRDICTKISLECVMTYGTINTGTEYKDGHVSMLQRNGKVILNPELAKELLPTCEGFFFGGTDYDEWYMGDIITTIEIIDKVLAHTNFKTHAIYYQSSW